MNDNHIADERKEGDKATCGACNGTGRMVRDPDIGTDQECFVCDGSGVFEDAAPIAPRAGAENDELIGRMDWCIKWATMGEATRQVMIDARALLAAPIAPRADADTAGAKSEFQAFSEWSFKKEGEAIGRMDGNDAAWAGWEARAILEAGASNERADAAPKPSDKPYVETQPGSPNFDGAEAWEAHLDALFGPERADAEKDAALTDAQIIEIFRDHYTEEPGDAEPGHILPFARAILAAIKNKENNP